MITDVKKLFTLPSPIGKPVYAVTNISIIRINRGAVATEDMQQLAKSQFHPTPSQLQNPQPTQQPSGGGNATSAQRGPAVNSSFEGGASSTEAKLAREVKKLFCDESSRARTDFFFVPDGNLCSTYQRYVSTQENVCIEIRDRHFPNTFLCFSFLSKSFRFNFIYIPVGITRFYHILQIHRTDSMKSNDYSLSTSINRKMALVLCL